VTSRSRSRVSFGASRVSPSCVTSTRGSTAPDWTVPQIWWPHTIRRTHASDLSSPLRARKLDSCRGCPAAANSRPWCPRSSVASDTSPYGQQSARGGQDGWNQSTSIKLNGRPASASRSPRWFTLKDLPSIRTAQQDHVVRALHLSSVVRCAFAIQRRPASVLDRNLTHTSRLETTRMELSKP
jgi:hypothetical protein